MERDAAEPLRIPLGALKLGTMVLWPFASSARLAIVVGALLAAFKERRKVREGRRRGFRARSDRREVFP